jgi:hypothetical protein
MQVEKMFRRKIQTVLFILPLMFMLIPSNNVHSEYLALGEIEGEVCTDYVLYKSCKTVTLDAFKADDGEVYEIRKTFPDVTEYNESRGKCRIELGRSKGKGLWTRFYNSFLTQDFYYSTKTGELEEVHPENITFSCRKK